jgi:hypothetical protein
MSSRRFASRLESGSSSKSVSGSAISARQRHPLLLAAGEFGRIALRQRLELCGAKDRAEVFRDGVAGLFAQAQAIGDVVCDRHMRPHRVALKDHRHLALLRRQRLGLRGDEAITDADLAVGRLQKARDQPQGRCLAAAGRAEQADEFAMIDHERDVIDHGERRERLVRPRNSTDATFIPPGLSWKRS